MKREILEKLIEWKKREDRKPLVLTGARQVGKTWVLKELGQTQFEKMAYVNFEEMKPIRNLFVGDFDMQRIIVTLNAASRVSITEGDTLLVLDEIQAAEGGLTALKYFCERMPDLHVVAAGSLLGVEMHRHTSYPVGKVHQLMMYPMNFREFLLAMGEEQMHGLLVHRQWEVLTMFSARMKELLRQYYYVGGMPEAVKVFSEKADFKQVREIQQDILLSYERDFSKHAPAEIVPRIKALWNSIPAQLARENKKFIYRALRTGARAKDYELALQWLSDCGLCYQVFNISVPQYPIKSMEQREAFKLFALDIGLLTAMNQIDIQTYLDGNALFVDFKGALTEQYVCQQLISATSYGIPHYWTSKTGKAEIDFVIQKGNTIVPIEVKAEENLQAKSLKIYVEKYKPELAVRTSMSDYREESWLVNWPLFQIGEL